MIDDFKKNEVAQSETCSQGLNTKSLGRVCPAADPELWNSQAVKGQRNEKKKKKRA